MQIQSDNFAVVQHPLYLEVVEEADDQDYRNGEEPKAYRFERYHFLQLHVVLINGHGVLLPLLYLLEHFV